MLDSTYSDVGVATEVGQLNGYSGAHIWVTHFGMHC
jgi:hypothetical protein